VFPAESAIRDDFTAGEVSDGLNAWVELVSKRVVAAVRNDFMAVVFGSMQKTNDG
jgi:precorrin-3B methylase